MSRVTNEALDKIAAYYGRLPKLINTMGRGNISPERVIEEVASLFLGDNASGTLRWCEGHGINHFWLSVERLHTTSYSLRCELHQERRQKERRRA